MVLALKIDVTKIEKARLFKGEKGTYLDAIVFLNEEKDQYGNNGMVVQSVSKEEKVKGVKGPILGNAKIVGGGGSATQEPQQASTPAPVDNLPF
jgi:hypothetical protein